MNLATTRCLKHFRKKILAGLSSSNRCQKAKVARERFDSWRQNRRDEKLQKELNQSELELEEASNLYASELKQED